MHEQNQMGHRAQLTERGVLTKGVCSQKQEIQAEYVTIKFFSHTLINFLFGWISCGSQEDISVWTSFNPDTFFDVLLLL